MWVNDHELVIDCVDRTIRFFEDGNEIRSFQFTVEHRPTAVRVANVLRQYGFKVRIQPFGLYTFQLTVNKK